MVTPTPTRVRVRTYRVGFGDCLLVTIGYSRALPDGRAERHVLVDFGAKVLAKAGPTMAQIAAAIAEHCDGRLDAVVVTHRHQDHVRGFGDAKARKHLEQLDPGLVVRPWTDRPAGLRDSPDAGLGPASHGLFALLDTVAAHGRAVGRQFALDRRVLAERARELAELGVSNVEALAMLDAWVSPDRTRWVRAGDVVDVDEVLPGVSLEVLGPPTLEQVPGLRSYASSSAEYWLGLAAEGSLDSELLAPGDRSELVPEKERVAAPEGLGRASWLLDRLHDKAPSQVLEIVEGFDDVLNNTSVVLLLGVGRRSILLAGDAQVENWSWSLDRAYGEDGAELRARLADVDLYKVGHHGSRNATPRRLVQLWRTERAAGHELCSVVSTLSGTYGTTAEGKVPKDELLRALEGLGPVHSTEDLPADAWWFDVEARTARRSASFSYSPGPRQA